MRSVTRQLLAIALSASLGLPAVAQDGRPQQVYPPGIRGGSETVPEPRVEVRTYLFRDTGEQLPYSVFVSSKIKRGQKAPLILALRGFTGTTLTFVRGTAVDLAERNGYILVGAIGYNNRAGFGVPARPRPADAGPQGTLPPLEGGTAETDPVKVTAYSEKDVMNVLALVRQEFNVDERRVYLVGHSQGGGGARHLAEKYATTWAAVAMLAPAVFDVQLTAESRIGRIPLLLAVGDQDSLITRVRSFRTQLESLHFPHDYREMPGLDHGTIIMGAMPEVFRFFGEHAKPVSP